MDQVADAGCVSSGQGVRIAGPPRDAGRCVSERQQVQVDQPCIATHRERIQRQHTQDLGIAVLCTGADSAEIAEPDGYKLDHFRSPVPARLKCTQTVDAKTAWKLWQAGHTLFIDVMPQAPKPKNLPEGTFWRERTRDTIPGSYWLANVGYGRLHPEAEAWFKAKLALLTGANKERPVLFYCLMNCWMSWNAAKRALTYGYRNVIWFPEGTDGWSFESYPLKAQYPDMYLR